MHRVLNEAQKDHVEMLLFCSREGFLLEQIYSRISSPMNPQSVPQSIYSYLNRKSVYASSLHEIGRREIEMGFDTTSPSVRNFLKRFSLPVDELAVVALEAGIDDLDHFVTNPYESKEFLRFLKDPRFLSAVQHEKQQTHALLYEYLNQIGFWKKDKVALVDVGWNGTTQQALAIGLNQASTCPEISGYYMALLGRMTLDSPPNSDFHGIYFDYRKQSSGISFARYVELFETACRAPHPTVTGFVKNPNGIVEPTFKDSNSIECRLEHLDEAWVSSIQSGILAYCDDYTATLRFHERSPEEEGDFILYRLDRLLRYPNKEEAEVLTDFSHSEGFGQSMVHIPDKLNSGSNNKNNYRSINYNHRTLWREGRYAQSRIPGLNTLLNSFRLLKTSRY